MLPLSILLFIFFILLLSPAASPEPPISMSPVTHFSGNTIVFSAIFSPQNAMYGKKGTKRANFKVFILHCERDIGEQIMLRPGHTSG
ncbi:MAG: hypothetical protein JOS17DRAFT_749683 [Linnemannia elongata]|nr:MAG: hypothetical protein JOS17DRAFT_749683 [Linnemannia elongata]